MKKIEKNELVEFLKKISENTLTKELEIEAPLGLPHGVVGIRPQIVKVDVKWLISQILNELEDSTVSEVKNNDIAICTKDFFDFISDKNTARMMVCARTIQAGDKFIIDSKDGYAVCLTEPNTKLTFILSTAFYDEHFKEIKGGM